SEMIESSEINEVVKKGGVGELLGHFYSREGKLLETMLTSRTLAISVGEKISGEVVALAGGSKKVDPLRAVLESGRLTGLITDELTAKALVNG
ncbi:MAG: sugar-binding domain-containing protein, partial [Pseudoruegeria sp.]